jgi:hypothetical protein
MGSTMSVDEAGAGALERRYRMTLDFRVLIGDIAEQDVAAGDGGDENEGQDYVARQRRLLRALLRDEAVLAEFMTYLVTDRLCGHSDSELGRVFGVRPQEEMLEPVYSGMREDDAQFFREMREADIFWENTERMEMSFEVEWTGASLIEIKWEREGDTTAERGSWT